jgi:hypothetical protein
MNEFDLDIIIDTYAPMIGGCNSSDISAPAREKIRSDVLGMLSKDFRFQTDDELQELSKSIQGWTNKYPNK